MITRKKLIKKLKDSVIVFASVLFHIIVILILTLFILKQPEIKEEIILTTSSIAEGNDNDNGFDQSKQIDTIKEETNNNEIDDTENVEAMALDQINDDQKSIPIDRESIKEEEYQLSFSNFGSYSSAGIKNEKLSARFGSNKYKALLRNGGSKKTEAAVSSGVAWLIRHQEKDGHWDTLKHTDDKSRNTTIWDPGVSALALLAILGAGNSDKTGKYKKNVTKALDWMQNHQDKNGCYALSDACEYSYWTMYNHALCTMAMAEAYGMSANKKYKKSIEKAIRFISLYRNKKGLWGYLPHDKRYDSSIIGWVTMALKAAKLSGIYVSKTHFQNIRKHCISSPKDISYGRKISSFDPTLNYTDLEPHSGRRGPAMTGIGMLLLMYTGSKHNSTRLFAGAEKLVTATPKWIKGSNKGFAKKTSTYSGTGFNNEYTWYYGTLVMFQMGGKFWKIWNREMQSTLLPNQSQGDLKDGSPEDISGSWPTLSHGFGTHAGRVYMTSMACLNLEVYYRYTKFFKKSSK